MEFNVFDSIKIGLASPDQILSLIHISMHAPFELVSKTDVYMTYRAFVEFLKA